MNAIAVGVLAGVLAGLIVLAFGTNAAIGIAITVSVLVIAAGARDYTRTRRQ